MQKITGDHFTTLHNALQIVKPSFDMRSPGNIDESNVKKEIAQQIINNPTE